MGNDTKKTNEPATNTPRKKQLRGFARNPALAAAAGRKGGMSVPPSERSFSKNPDLARKAGRKGGQSVSPEERSFSKNPELARKAGRKGGQSVPPAERSFAKNPELAREAGRKGGSSSGTKRAGLAARKAAAAAEGQVLTAPDTPTAEVETVQEETRQD